MARPSSSASPTEATCLYCSATKPLAAFNREHVVPQSFGTFAENQVLVDAVCEECNSYFSRELELPLGRDSMEGLERFRSGLVKPKKGGRTLPNERITARHRGGLQDGALLEWRLSADGNSAELCPVAQLGFARSSEGPFTWYAVDDLPTAELLRELGFKEKGVAVQAAGMSVEDAAKQIHDLGYEGAELEGIDSCPPGPDGKIPVHIDGTIDQALQRAVAKIAFNYLAFHHREIAYMPQFDRVRAYIRYGTPPPILPVSVSEQSILGDVPPDRQLLVHTLTVTWDPAERRVVGQVSLFSWVTYRVFLSEGVFPALPPLQVEKGHAFDPHNHCIHEISRRVPPAMRKPIPMQKLGEP